MRFIFFYFMFSCSTSLSQISVETSFNILHIGFKQNVQAYMPMGSKLNVYGGLGFLTNNENTEVPINTLYKRGFIARSFNEALGGVLGINYQLWSAERLSLCGFVETHYSRSTVKSISFLAIDTLVSNPNSSNDFVYARETRYISPVTAIGGTLGISLSVFFNEHWYYKQKIGGGLTYIKSADPTIILVGAQESLSLSEFFSFGLGYKF